MAKRKSKQQEDEDYTSQEPKTYRRYARKTKLKYCFLVKKLGWKPATAAKLLKIKGSTAKMILKKFVHPNLDNLEQIFEKTKNGVRIQKIKVEESDQNKLQFSNIEPTMYYIVYYPKFPIIFHPQPQPQFT